MSRKPQSNPGAHNVYGAYCPFPSHRFSDLNGMVRAVVRASSRHSAVRALRRAGISVEERDFGLYWTLTRSIMEKRATQGHSHEVLVCPIPLAYLKVEYYEPAAKPRIELRLETKGGTVEEREREDAARGERVREYVERPRDFLSAWERKRSAGV